MTTKYTPGPWRADPAGMSFTLSGTAGEPAKGRLAASIFVGDSYRPMIRVGARTDDREEVRANTLLIAAAPDLFDEAKKQVVWLKHIRERLAGIAPESIITGIDQSLKSFEAVIAKVEA